jgi:hypothetical protein
LAGIVEVFEFVEAPPSRQEFEAFLVETLGPHRGAWDDDDIYAVTGHEVTITSWAGSPYVRFGVEFLAQRGGKRRSRITNGAVTPYVWSTARAGRSS